MEEKHIKSKKFNLQQKDVIPFIEVAPHRHQLKKLIVPQNEKNESNSHK